MAGGEKMSRLIFHVDVNSAFLSWEAAKRVRDGGEDLRLIPSAIGGDVEKRAGIILAKSIPAKKFGVTTGEPVVTALRKCPGLVLAKPDFRLYSHCSHAFVAILREYAPIVEQASIDECFLDMTGTGLIYPDPVAIAHEIKDRIRDELGFTVNIGIAENKLCAKMASDFEKPDRVHTLFPAEIPRKMWRLPVRDLLGIGGSTADRLERAAIRTIGQLANCDLSIVQSLVGVKNGIAIHNSANGIDDSPVSDHPEESKGYSISTTVPHDITQTDEAYRVLLALADSVSSRMRADGFMCRCVSVSLRTSGFKNRSHQTTLDATDITNEIFEVSKRLFDELWDKKTPLRLLGIALTDLTRERTVQLSLFHDESDEVARERSRKLDRTVDDIRKRFGHSTIILGVPPEKEVGGKYKAQLDERRKDT